MKIAVILNCHNHPELVIDTLESIKTWVSKDILVMIDSAGIGNFSNVSWKDNVIEAPYHGYYKSPYRNITFGLKKLYETFQNFDFYLYVEYDCIFTGNSFLSDIIPGGISCYTNDVRTETRFKLPTLEKILNIDIKTYKGMLGCCVFYSHDFIKKLYEIGFYDKLLDFSKGFSTGSFPDYDGYAFEEVLYPTLVNHFNGEVRQLGVWNGDKWSNRKYIMRFKPEITTSDLSGEASIVHPLKKLNCPVRKHYKKIRDEYLKWNNITFENSSVSYSGKNLEYIITGTGRSGTVFLSELFNSIGISCGHERIFTSSGCSYKNYGVNSDSSMWAGAKPVKDPFTPLMAESSYMAAPFLNDGFLKDSKVIHVVRNPLSVINSFLNGLKYFQYTKDPSNSYEKFIAKYLPDILNIQDPLLRACYYYVQWNLMIENLSKDKPYFRYCVESDLNLLFNYLGVNPSNYYNNKKCNSVIDKNNLKLSDIPECSIKKDLLDIFRRYYS